MADGLTTAQTVDMFIHVADGVIASADVLNEADRAIDRLVTGRGGPTESSGRSKEPTPSRVEAT